jgi:hypothetical protein
LHSCRGYGCCMFLLLVADTSMVMLERFLWLGRFYVIVAGVKHMVVLSVK